MGNKKSEKLKEVKDEVVNFKESPLYEYRKTNNNLPVIGEGSHNAKIMFIGEAPGRNEAEKGRPFCGRAGAILDELLQFIGLERSNVYITNIVKDRPPENKDPSFQEIEAYAPFLFRQINIIRPEIIATLGRFSMEHIMKKFGLEDKLQPISKIHGQVFEANTDYGNIKIIPFYHPAVAIYRAESKEALKEDFQILKQFK